MGFWSSLVEPRGYRASYAPTNDFWFNPIHWSRNTLSGAPAGPDAAMRTSAVWACVNLLSRTQAMLPAIVYQQRDDGGKDRDPEHEVAQIFRVRPNVWQSGFEFRQYKMVSLLLRGNFYGLKVYDRGRLSQIVPLNADRVTAVQLSSRRMGYVYRPLKGPEQPLTQDDVWHIRGLSLDGVTGVSVIEYARETIGRAIAQEGYAASFYRNGMEASTYLTTPGNLTPQAREALKADLAAKTGYQNTGKTLLLEQNTKIEKLALTARDSQFVEGSYATIEDICRWFGMQPHMIAHLLRATNNNIEQQSLEYVDPGEPRPAPRPVGAAAFGEPGPRR